MARIEPLIHKLAACGNEAKAVRKVGPNLSNVDVVRAHTIFESRQVPNYTVPFIAQKLKSKHLVTPRKRCLLRRAKGTLHG